MTVCALVTQKFLCIAAQSFQVSLPDCQCSSHKVGDNKTKDSSSGEKHQKLYRPMFAQSSQSGDENPLI
jgi:hypothetical protein